MKHGNACTRHPRDKVRSNGRCGYCLAEAQKRYMTSLQDSRRQLRQIEAVMSVASTPRVML